MQIDQLILPDVTLVLIETREHDLAQLALEDCESQVQFGDVLVFTDRPSQFIRADRRVIAVPDWPDKVGWSRCFWYDVALHVRTSHALGIQWDSWVVNPVSWLPEFLNYDYLGSPWWYEDGMNVGNGGFSLRSATFMRFIRKNRDRYPCVTDVDDDLYCRKYRPQLQDEAGFRWAPQDLAARFAFECVAAPQGIKPFGFHSPMNFPKVLSGERVVERMKLMQRSKNLANGNRWKSLADNNPDLLQKLNGGDASAQTLKEESDDAKYLGLSRQGDA